MTVLVDKEMESGGNYYESKQSLWFSSIIFVPFFTIRNLPRANSAIVTEIHGLLPAIMLKVHKIEIFLASILKFELFLY